MALIARHIILTAQDRRILRETSPGLSCTEIYHDEARAAFVGRINEVGNSFAGRVGKIRIEVESQVIEIAVRIVHTRREGESLVDGVVRQIDRYKFRSAWLGVGHAWVTLRVMHSRSSGVNRPEGLWTLRVARCYVHSLHADESRGISRTERDPVPGRVELVGR